MITPGTVHILETLSDHPDGLTLAELGAASGRSEAICRRHLHRLIDAGRVRLMTGRTIPGQRVQSTVYGLAHEEG